MPSPNLFLDTNIILDYVLFSGGAKYACSYELVERIRKGEYEAYTADYTLAETLGELKAKREEKIGVKDIPKETLSQHEIGRMVTMIEEFRKTPHFEVFEPEPVAQEQIFDKVKSVCVQSTDALVLLSALDLKKRLGNLILVTRDEKLLARGKRLIETAHPMELVGACPPSCLSKENCRHYRR